HNGGGDTARPRPTRDPPTRHPPAAGPPPRPRPLLEKPPPPAPRWPDAPAAYLQLSHAYQDQAAKARELGWPVTEQISHHLAPLTQPSQVTESLRELTGQLRQSRPAPEQKP